MKKKKDNTFYVRLLAAILAGLMIVSVATSVIIYLV